MKLKKIEIEKIKEILKNSYQILSDRTRWCQGFLYIKEQGCTKFCAVGAAREQAFHVQDSFGFLKKALEFLDYISNELYSANIIELNDQLDENKAYQDVLHVYLEAIDRLEKLEKSLLES